MPVTSGVHVNNRTSTRWVWYIKCQSVSITKTLKPPQQEFPPKFYDLINQKRQHKCNDAKAGHKLMMKLTPGVHKVLSEHKCNDAKAGHKLMMKLTPGVHKVLSVMPNLLLTHSNWTICGVQGKDGKETTL